VPIGSSFTSSLCWPNPRVVVLDGQPLPTSAIGRNPVLAGGFAIRTVPGDDKVGTDHLALNISPKPHKCDRLEFELNLSRCVPAEAVGRHDANREPGID